MFVIMVIAAISIVWSTLRLGISPMPSSKQACSAMLQLIDETSDGPIYDLGSGWGGMLISLAKKYPNRTIIGYELSPLPWLTTLVLIRVFGLSNIELYRKNFLQADLSCASVLVCYLFPKGMAELEAKLKKEGGVDYLISHHFALPSCKSIKEVKLNDLYKTPIYLYEFK